MNDVISQIPLLVNMQGVSLSLPGTDAARPVPILREIDLCLSQNDTVALVGPSGSGKTSLMMLMAGLEAPTQGSIEVCGESLADKNEDDLARFRARNIGIVFQSFHLIPTMTALENVALPLEFSNHADAREQAQSALVSLGLGHRLGHYPAQLSGGEQQRVAIARAFVTHPKLLLADEPTGNLDHATGAQVIDLLFDLRERHGTTLLLITHDTALAARCGRMVRLADGRVATQPDDR